jgi:hypothetical protein
VSRVAPHHDRIARLRTAWVAAVVLVSQASVWLHDARTPHVTCQEHGEAVHLDLGGNSPAGDDSRHDAVPSIYGVVLEHQHDHCGIVHSTGGPAWIPAAIFVPAGAAPPPGRPVAAGGKPVHLLRLAPKTSPPSALV